MSKLIGVRDFVRKTEGKKKMRAVLYERRLSV